LAREVDDRNHVQAQCHDPQRTSPSFLTAFSLTCRETKTSRGKSKKDFSSAGQDVTDAHESTYALTDPRRERRAGNEVRPPPGGAKPAASAHRDAGCDNGS
jgi:hypothetical protein